MRLFSQTYINTNPSSSELFLDVKKLATCGSVLYIAAHPDDENTRMLAWFAAEPKVETSYLSLTRGDGGQNLIGTEQSELLGMIRTQELLAARNIDGAKQYFTRALDFGFSKNPEETFTKWNKDTLLGDVVFFIRKLKPDVIITRFSPEPSSTHGHHTASAQLALLAFHAAADSTQFPEQLAYVSTHKAHAIYWNTSWFHYGTKDFDKTGLLAMNIGTYSAPKGKWIGEIGAESRSQHSSQGFGAARLRGEEMEYLHFLAGTKASSHPLENIDQTWNRVPGAKGFSKKINKIIANFDFVNASNNLPALIDFRKDILALPASYYRDLKLEEINAIILKCAGVFVEANVSKADFRPDEYTNLVVSATSNLNKDVFWYIDELGSARVNNANSKWTKDSVQFKFSSVVTNLYWLKNAIKDDFFQLDNPHKDLLNPGLNLSSVGVTIRVMNTEIKKQVPIVYKYVQPEKGELYTYPRVLAPVVVKSYSDLIISKESVTYPEFEIQSSQDYETLEMVGLLKNGKAIFRKIILNVKKGEKRFEKVVLPMDQLEGNMNSIEVKLYHNSKEVGFQVIHIDYDHIPSMVLQRSLQIQAIKLDAEISKKKIAYIDGAGDKVGEILKLAGSDIHFLKPEEFSLAQFKKYDVIVMGIRAFNTNKSAVAAVKDLKTYMHEGGRLIVQYQTTASLLSKDFAPYSFVLGRDRVTDEFAPVEFLVENHPLLKGISSADFEGWVQERGLYFPSQLGPEYQKLLGMNDAGESKKEHALVYAKYGQGDFVYTGLSFFRQLPAGNKGALRLFMALIEN